MATQNARLLKELIKLNRRGMSRSEKKRQARKASPRILYPKNIEQKYYRNIRKLLAPIIKTATTGVAESLAGWRKEFNEDSFKMDAFDTELGDLTDQLNEMSDEIYRANRQEVIGMLREIGYDVSDHNRQQINKILNRLVGVTVQFADEWEEKVVNAWAQNNFTLVKSLNDEYIKKINNIVAEGVQSNQTVSTIMESVRKLNKNISQSRARLIASDQVGKLNGQVTKRRQQDLGIDMYTWLTAGDERVRGNPSGRYKNAIPSHYAINRKLCRWDNNTVYSEDGGKTWIKRTGEMPLTIPGSAIMCRCVGIGMLDDLIKEIDNELAKEAT